MNAGAVLIGRSFQHSTRKGSSGRYGSRSLVNAIHFPSGDQSGSKF